MVLFVIFCYLKIFLPLMEEFYNLLNCFRNNFYLPKLFLSIYMSKSILHIYFKGV